MSRLGCAQRQWRLRRPSTHLTESSEARIKMNWMKILFALKISIVVGGAASVGAIFWGMVFAGLAQKIVGLGERESMLLVFCPTALLVGIYLLVYLPSPLRKAGILGRPLREMGPWWRNG